MVKRCTSKIRLMAGTSCLLILALALVTTAVHGRPMEAEVAGAPSEQQTMTILDTATKRQQQDLEKEDETQRRNPGAGQLPSTPDQQQTGSGSDDDDRSSIDQGSANEKEDEREEDEVTSAPQTQVNTGTRNPDADTPQTTHNPSRCQKCCHVIKKVLLPLDDSEFDHRDFVVSDREYELVLRRLMSENSTGQPANVDAPVSITTESPVGDGHERAGRSIDKSHRPGVAPERGSHSFHPNECFICLDEFPRRHSGLNGETTPSDSFVELVLFCGHKFHLGCISAWYRANRPRSKRCPVCMGLMRFSDGKLFELHE